MYSHRVVFSQNWNRFFIWCFFWMMFLLLINWWNPINRQEKTFITIFEIPKDPDQYSLWHSTQMQTNITKYKNVKIDKLLEDARTTSDENKRKELYFDFQKFLMEDAPATFIYHPYRYQVNYKNIRQLLEKLPKTQNSFNQN